MRNIFNIRCHVCNDLLTEGELRRHHLAVKGMAPTCFQCNMKIIENKRKEYQLKQQSV